MSELRRGFLLGLGAYVLWGLFPLYFRLLDAATPLEVLAERIVWSLAVMVAVLLVRRRWSWIGPLLKQPRQLLMLCVAAVMIATNWGIYIYAVNTGRVVESSLGYFINPLVTVVLGVVVLHEHLRRLQWIAVALGAAAVLVLTVEYGTLPWISLSLAFTFGTYGLLKKTLDMSAVESLSVETAVLAPLAFLYLGWLWRDGEAATQQHGWTIAVLLATTGVVTVVPLLMFGAAATRIPLTWLGLLQYVTPVLQFLIGVVIFGEVMSPARWAGFILVWTALVILAAESLANSRRTSGLRSATHVDEAEVSPPGR